MGRNIVEKILESHLVDGSSEPGQEVAIRIDQTLTQDATGTMVYLQFEALGFEKVRTELSVSYVDHNTVQEGFENNDDHKYLESVARKFGIKYSRAGNGICHQVHLERFGIPGKTLLGSDSHTPTGGGIGMLAIGAGGLDVAVAMGGGPFYTAFPRVIRVNLTGVLQPWVAAKDVILKVLEVLGTKGNVGCVVEYGGPGVESLSVPERSTITNMGAELGVTTSVFPSDNATRRFLEAQGRAEVYVELSADADAKYERTITIDLDALRPLAACPHSPGNIKPVSEVQGIAVDQILIGSCTNSSFKDLTTVAKLLKGRKVNPRVSFGVAAGSRQVMEMIARNGGLADIISSGARILESACGFCIGNSMAPNTDAVSLRTSNRNFYGRSGTTTAQVFLVSPETAVASALAGTFVDPREYFADREAPSFELPSQFVIDDSMVVDADFTGEIYRGPNIGQPPSTVPVADIHGVVSMYLGDKITTDHIMPAGSRMKYRSNIPKYAEFVFERNDPDFARKALENKEKGIHNVIVAGESYGQGSSREHAAICPMYLGVKMVLARSIERIHKANLVNFGIVPAVFENADDYDKNIALGDSLTVSALRSAVEGQNMMTVRNETKEIDIPVRLELTRRERTILLAGGLINSTRAN